MALPVNSLDSAVQSLEDLEIELLLTAIARYFGYDFRSYAKASLRRRILCVVQEQGVETISGLQEKLLHYPDLLRSFISTLSVHVTSLFRDPEFYISLREKVVPMLRTYPFVRVWVAGCATGEEVYSLAILLHEAGLDDRVRIYATDISDDLLERAKLGAFPLARMKLYTQNYQRASGKRDFSSYYRVRGDSVYMDDALKKSLVFSQHNLAADAAFNEFQLVFCRNVMIYFDQELRQRVHRLFYDSLSNFGVICLGLRESIRFTSVENHFEALDDVQKIYRRTR
jgi:chemotaxis protein methyltransferase CheR